MGWTFTQGASRAEIIASIIRLEDTEFSRFETKRHCTRGNVLWTVQDYTNKKTGENFQFIGCHLLERSVEKRGVRKIVSWGYKSMEEQMHPRYYSCPLSYLDEVPETCPDWRKQVRQYNRKIGVGDKLILCSCRIPYVIVQTVRPLVGVYEGHRYKVSRNLISDVQPTEHQGVHHGQAA